MQTKISIKVHPNAGGNEIVGLANGVWKIRIAAPPDKGKANKELIEFLSDRLGLRKDSIAIVRGEASHNKIVAIDGLSGEEIANKLNIRK